MWTSTKSIKWQMLDNPDTELARKILTELPKRTVAQRRQNDMNFIYTDTFTLSHVLRDVCVVNAPLCACYCCCQTFGLKQRKTAANKDSSSILQVVFVVTKEEERKKKETRERKEKCQMTLFKSFPFPPNRKEIILQSKRR